MEYTHQIIDFRWVEKQGIFFPQCGLREWQSGEETWLELVAGYEFNWELSEENYCLGFTDEHGEAHQCPTKRKMEGKYERCYSCEQKDGFKLAFFMKVEPNARMKKHLDQAHFVYLAYFYPNIVKVGTAAKSRKYVRLIEQDALFAGFVAAASGHAAQQLEAQIAAALQLTRSVRQGQKQAGLFERLNAESAKRTLSEHWERLRHLAKGGEKLSLLEDIEYVDFTNQPHIYFHPPHLDQPVFKVDVPRSVVGSYLGLRGKQLIVEKDNSINTYSTNKLVGKLFRAL